MLVCVISIAKKVNDITRQIVQPKCHLPKECLLIIIIICPVVYFSKALSAEDITS